MASEAPAGDGNPAPAADADAHDTPAGEAPTTAALPTAPSHEDPRWTDEEVDACVAAVRERLGLPAAKKATPTTAPAASSSASASASGSGAGSAAEVDPPAAAATVDDAPAINASDVHPTVEMPAAQQDQRKLQHDLSLGTLRRFAKARKLNADDAASMLRRYLDWRAETNVDAIRAAPFPFHKVYHHATPHMSYPDSDRAGRVVYYERTGAIDVPKLLSILEPSDLTDRHIWHMEHQEERAGDEGRIAHVMDLKHLSMSPNSAGLQLFKTTTFLDQNYYPERLGVIFVLNAPWIFGAIWAVISPWVDPATKAKFRILGSDYQEALVAELGAENVPVEHGGTCERAIGKVLGLSADCGYHEYVVGAGARETHVVEFGSEADVAAGAQILWLVRTASNNIGFEVVWVPGKTATADGTAGTVAASGAVDGNSGSADADAAAGVAVVVVVKAGRVDSHKAAVRGRFTPPGVGRLELRFDNSFSRFTSKTVRLLVDSPYGGAEADGLDPPVVVR